MAPVRKVALLAAGMIVAILGATGLIARDRYEREIRVAGAEMQTLSILLAEETSRSLQSVQLVLKSIAEHVAARGINTAVAYEERMTDHATHELLRAKLSGVPQLDAITTISATGRLLNFSRSWPIPPVNVSDRDYYAALRNSPADRPFLSEPVQNRGTGTWTIYLAQRLDGDGGAFMGLILAAIELSYFERLYGSLGVPSGTSITLWREDGVLLARHPTIGAGQRRPPNGMVPTAGAGMLFETDAGLEGADAVPRLIASRRLGDYPVLVNVARTKDEILAPWRRDLAFIAGAATLCILSVLLAMWAAIRQFRHYEALVEATADRERAVVAREESERQLQQVQKLEAVGQLTAGIAHDFNNLLTVVLGGVDIGRRLASGNGRLENIFANIGLAAERGANLTGHLLSFARKQTLSAEVIDVARHVAAVVQLLRRAVNAHIVVEGSVPEAVWRVEVDPGQLQLALLNIGLNSRDAMPEGGVIRIAAENRRLANPESGLTGDFVAISVRDTGSGIRPEIRDRIFEPFFTTKEIGKGSGLGLSQAYGFATQSGGTIQLDSTVGAGTIVTLILPAVPVPAIDPEPAQRPPVEARGSGRILLVEDEIIVAEMVADALRDIGYEVVAVHDAVSALRKLENQGPFSLLFSDITMPGGMDGIELARHVRAMHPEMPVLLTTGYSDSMREMRPRDFPVLRKPYELGELQKQIEACIEGRA